MRAHNYLALFLLCSACDDTILHVAPDPVDTGVVIVDAAPPAVDAGHITPDAGFADAEPPPMRALEPIYIHTGNTLFSYDPLSNSATTIGDFHDRNGPIEGVVDIAIDLDGKMFGGTRDQKIYFIDAATGFCDFRFDFDDILHGLTFLADGSLVVAGERVSIVNPITGQVQIEIVAARDYETSGDIVGLPDGKLYWTVRNQGPQASGDGVVRISPLSGRIDWLGEASVQGIYGLGYSEDKLYGFSTAGVVVTIDPESGDVLRSLALEGRWWGATTNPVHW